MISLFSLLYELFLTLLGSGPEGDDALWCPEDTGRGVISVPPYVRPFVGLGFWIVALFTIALRTDRRTDL